MLEVENANVYYGKKQVLYDISMELEDGVYGLIGENGAGKTTLISLITGLKRAKSGVIRWDGRDIKDIGRSYYDYIGYLPQFPSLYGDFYPGEFLSYMSELKGINRKIYRKKIPELLRLVGLEGETGKRIAAFSGGMRQRLGIAQALIGNPRLLILDEPTAGLDPKERIRFRNLITELSEGRIVLLATHIISDVENIARKIIFLHKGRIIKSDTADNLIGEINGRVYEAKMDADTYERADKSLFSNVMSTGEVYRVRGFVPEGQERTAVLPNLEDVFLYHMNLGIEESADDKVRI